MERQCDSEGWRDGVTVKRWRDGVTVKRWRDGVTVKGGETV